MTVINTVIDPLWHEELLTISILNQGSYHRSELINRIRCAQETKVAPFKPHSESAYRYWFRALKSRGIVTEEDKILSLTNLGRWVAAGAVGILSTRNQFAYLVCDRSSSDTRIVLRTPLMDTLTSNAKGDPFVDIKCPVCGDISSRHNLGSIASRESIVDFYNQAFTDLKKFVTVVGTPI